MELLDRYNAYMTANFGDFGPLMVVGLLGFFMVLMTLPILMRKREDPLDKLRRASQQSAPQKTAEVLRTDSKNEKLEKYANFLEPQSEEEYSAARLKLLQAGYRSKDAVRAYHFLQFALGLIGLVLGGLYAWANSLNADLTTQQMALSVILPGGAGYMLPKYWVTRRKAMREEGLINGFPDALDLMLVCVEAGQSIDQSIIRVSTEIRAGSPELADEYEIVSNEMKAGKDRIAVLRDMSERCGVQDIASFVTVLIQSASFGTSIADALRVYAEEMRDKRVMRAEEKANTLPTKMTLATMLLTLPPLLIILIGPSVYEVSTTLGAMGK